jgi:voltage-gated potassium channel Kch
MKILIVGCGAVGQVFGLALQKAGVDLALYDLPANTERLELGRSQGGLPLFQVSRQHQHPPMAYRLTNYQVVKNMAEIIDFKPDQTWFATPSLVYYSEWFRKFLARIPCPRVVCYVPEGGRSEFYPEDGQDRLVFGGTTFMAWQGDLNGGGGVPEGVNFWRSPLAIPLIGTEKACGEVKLLLKKAGFRATVGKPDSHMQATVTAIMTAFVAGLELSGWSLKVFRRRPNLGNAARACREAVLGQLPVAGSLKRFLLGVPVFAASFFLADLFLPLFFPFEIEEYLKFHYTKTRDQTLGLLELFIKDCEKNKRPAEEIRELLQGLLELKSRKTESGKIG